MIVSRHHKLKYYTLLFVVTLFFIVLGSLMILAYFDLIPNTNSENKRKILPFFSILLYALAIYTPFIFYRNAPVIVMDNDGLIFRNKRFKWRDVTKINLTGKQELRYIFIYYAEASRLEFSDGTTLNIFDDYYSNAPEIKKFLKHQVLMEKDEVHLSVPSLIALNDYYDTFKDNQFTSFRGILLWSYAFIMLLYFNGKPLNLFAWIFLIGFSILWFFIHSYMMHYFKVGTEYFIVKNHNFFWVNKTYLLGEIEEVVFETQSRAPNILRVISKEFKSKTYPAGTLRDSTWLSMKDLLESKGIKVRNECI